MPPGNGSGKKQFVNFLTYLDKLIAITCQMHEMFPANVLSPSTIFLVSLLKRYIVNVSFPVPFPVGWLCFKVSLALSLMFNDIKETLNCKIGFSDPSKVYAKI